MKLKIVVFGLTMSSSWGNGHATLWRGLCRALDAMGHKVVFYERDVPFYAQHRDLQRPSYCQLVLYDDWAKVAADAERDLADACCGMVTSYCPDAIVASNLVLGSKAKVRAFYDLDTPITLQRAAMAKEVAYLPPRVFEGFDLVLSFTGGRALDGLREHLGARRAVPLYGSVDPEVHAPPSQPDGTNADFSYLGTYAADRQRILDELFLSPARRLPHKRFLLGGSMYPQDFPWEKNVYYVSHVPPPKHPSFYGGSGFTLNVTRQAMKDYGYCPSGRLFEAASCGVPVVTDAWEGLDRFFEPGREIIVAREAEDVVRALRMPEADRRRIAEAARARALRDHSAAVRAKELVSYLDGGDQQGG